MKHLDVIQNDGLNVVSVDAECDSCKGAGLYVGMGERDGAAVVCSSCKGAGRRTLKLAWRDPGGLKRRDDVRRVWASGCGICIAPSAVSGGVSYQEWLDDPDSVRKPDAEMRSHSCPRQWWQSAGAREDEPKPEEFDCSWGSFSSCKRFANKSECWRKWDAQRGIK